MSIVESGGNLCFYGVGYAINDIGYSFGFMNLLLGITEICTTLLVGNFVTKMPRKKSLAIAYGITPFLTFFFISPSLASSKFFCALLIMIMRVMTSKKWHMLSLRVLHGCNDWDWIFPSRNPIHRGWSHWGVFTIWIHHRSSPERLLNK